MQAGGQGSGVSRAEDMVVVTKSSRSRRAGPVRSAVKKSVTAKIKAASYKCGGKTPRERLSKLFGKFVRKTGERGATGFTYPQMSAVLRGVCKLKDQEFDLLWQ